MASSLDSTLRPSPSHSFLVLYTNYQKSTNTGVNQGMAPDWYLAFTVIFLILFRTPRLYPIIPSSCSITQKSSHGTPTKKVQRGFCTTACSKAFFISWPSRLLLRICLNFLFQSWIQRFLNVSKRPFMLEFPGFLIQADRRVGVLQHSFISLTTKK